MWAPLFRKWTLKSRSITLSSEFLSWLQTDGVILPPSVELSSTGHERTQHEDGEDDWEIEWQRRVEKESICSSYSSSSFPAFEAALTEAIAELGGAVVPKLNWSVPRDAAWVNGGTIKCETAGDVMLLLKSSDRMQNDLDRLEELQQIVTPSSALSSALQPVLTLRKWAYFHPSMHFRCFVRRSVLCAVSQREPSAFYPFLADEIPRLRTLLHTFFLLHITPILTTSLPSLFEEEGEKQVGVTVCVDVYVDRQGRIWVLDLAPWGPPTDALLFAWGGTKAWEGGRLEVPLVADDESEVGAEDEGGEGIVVRVVDGEEVRVLPDPWASCRVPLDLHGCVGLGSEAGPEGMLTGGLDMEAIMRATMEERSRRGGEVRSESSGMEEEDKEDEEELRGGNNEEEDEDTRKEKEEEEEEELGEVRGK